MIEINNLTRGKIDGKLVGEIAEKVLSGEKAKGTLSVVFACDARMRAINKKHRKKDKSTDVLSFSFLGDKMENKEESLGEIFVCPAYIKRYAKKFDLDYNKMPFKSNTYPDIKDLGRPTHYKEMVNIAKTLCQNFIFVRVDLYNVNGKVYFGELTFSDGSGYVAINPTEYEITVGDNIIIDQTIRDNDRRYRK